MNVVKTGTVAAFLLGLMSGVSLADAPAVGQGATCPDSVSSLSSATGLVIGCRCPENSMHGSVWGSNPYTADSSFCAAAQHAGVVPAGGGVVWAKITEGLASYQGSEKNGVKTSGYGPYGGSISFAGVPAAPGPSQADLSLCPGDMRGTRAPIKCHCPASALTGGTVWGTDIYTEDSAMCRAALHAGVISPEGGNITAVPIAGQQQYLGSQKNGVTSQDYGAWGASYILTP